jgi:2-keto-4-pentenoate hydratase
MSDWIEMQSLLARELSEASRSGQPCAPLHERATALGLALSPGNAYAIQRINRDERIRSGDRVVGRKIGLTSRAVQQQLGVDQPDFGALWARTAYGDGETVSMAGLIQPKVEAEVALVMGRDLDMPDATAADVIRATDFALAALEIVDSRIANWKISLFDTIADNASAAAFVIGADPVRLTDVKLRDARMTMTRNGAEASSGIGSACLGHPLNAAAWLARTLSFMGDPLRAGDIVLTGALGPMVAASAGDSFEARIEGLGAVAIHFAGAAK